MTIPSSDMSTTTPPGAASALTSLVRLTTTLLLVIGTGMPRAEAFTVVEDDVFGFGCGLGRLGKEYCMCSLFVLLVEWIVLHRLLRHRALVNVCVRGRDR